MIVSVPATHGDSHRSELLPPNNPPSTNGDGDNNRTSAKRLCDTLRLDPFETLILVISPPIQYTKKRITREVLSPRSVALSSSPSTQPAPFFLCVLVLFVTSVIAASSIRQHGSRLALEILSGTCLVFSHDQLNHVSS